MSLCVGWPGGQKKLCNFVLGSFCVAAAVGLARLGLRLCNINGAWCVS